MRHWLAVVQILVAASAFACIDRDDESSANAEERGPRFITLGADAIDTAQDALRKRQPNEVLTPIDVRNGVALLEYDAQNLLELSQLMHERHNRCSGFVQHDSLGEAEVALDNADRIAANDLVYSINNGPTVNVLMSELRASSILGTIRDLSAFKNRYYRSATGVDASNWIADTWRSLAADRPDVTVSQFTHTNFEQKSVILTIPGSTLRDEVVVLGGHLDSIAQGGATATAPGADDDASGIATLTEIIRVLLARDFHPQRTIHFIAYAAEEEGLLGSQAVVNDYKARGINVVGVMQLDMTNYKGATRDIYLITDHTNQAQNQFVEELIDRYTGATRGTDVCGYACSDHASWQSAGFPASMPYEAQLANDNPKIHTPGDTLEMSGNNVDHAVKFARMGAAFVAELGKGTVDTSHELMREEFEVAGWTTTGLWHRAVSSKCGPPGFSSPTHAMYFGQDGSCNFDTGARVTGTMTSPTLAILTPSSTLRFRYFRNVEPSLPLSRNDVATVAVIQGSTRTVVWSRSSNTASQPRWLMSDTISLAAFAGKSIQLRFEFDSISASNNRFTGWLVDDVIVTK